MAEPFDCRPFCSTGVTFLVKSLSMLELSLFVSETESEMFGDANNFYPVSHHQGRKVSSFCRIKLVAHLAPFVFGFDRSQNWAQQLRWTNTKGNTKQFSYLSIFNFLGQFYLCVLHFCFLTHSSRAEILFKMFTLTFSILLSRIIFEI